jgi:hypothetical protein
MLMLFGGNNLFTLPNKLLELLVELSIGNKFVASRDTVEHESDLVGRKLSGGNQRSGSLGESVIINFISVAK